MNIIKNEKAQALSETIIVFSFVCVMIMVFLIHTGLIQVIRIRLSMANRFMVYTRAHAKNPNAGRQLQDKVKLMLQNGPPVISNRDKQIKNLVLNCQEKSVSIAGLKLPFSPKLVSGEITLDYIFRSRIMRRITGKKKITLSSGKIVMIKDFLYKDFISLASLKKFFGYKKKKSE